MPDQQAYERDVASARAQLDAPAFAAAWAEGRWMTLDQALAHALQGMTDERVPHARVSERRTEPSSSSPTA